MLSVFVQKTNRQSDMSSPRVLPRPGQRASRTWLGLLGPTLNSSFPSLNVSSLERRVQQCASVVVTHIERSTRFQVIVFSRLVSGFTADARRRAWG